MARSRCRCAWSAGTVAAVVLLASAARADQPTLDQLLDIAPPAQPVPNPSEPDPPAEPAEQGPTIEIDPEVQRLLETGSLGDALASAVDQMGDVAVRLDRSHDPGIETQRRQEDILRKLDQVIAAATQQQQQQSSSSSSSSTQQQQSGNQPQSAAQQQQQAASASTAPSAGEASPGEPLNPQDQTPLSMEELRDSWGNLPPRLRNELTDGYSERFSPLYRSLTEQYYQRLAEEQR